MEVFFSYKNFRANFFLMWEVLRPQFHVGDKQRPRSYGRTLSKGQGSIGQVEECIDDAKRL